MSTVTVYDPRFMTFERWSAMFGASAVSKGPAAVLQPVPEQRWKDWAKNLISVPAFAALNMPLPDRFHDWRSWAFAVNGVIYGAGP